MHNTLSRLKKVVRLKRYHDSLILPNSNDLAYLLIQKNNINAYDYQRLKCFLKDNGACIIVGQSESVLENRINAKSMIYINMKHVNFLQNLLQKEFNGKIIAQNCRIGDFFIDVRLLGTLFPINSNSNLCLQIISKLGNNGIEYIMRIHLSILACISRIAAGIVVMMSRELFDVQEFDRIVNDFYKSGCQQNSEASNFINNFVQDPNSWTVSDKILENSSNPNSKFLAIKVLEKLVATRWASLDRNSCEGIRNFVISLIISFTSQENFLHEQKLVLNKLNSLLVSIVKKEWPENWPEFITDVVGASRSNLLLCENNMYIFKLLSEEIFDFSAEQLTSARAKLLKTQLCNQFSEIFRLCLEIFENASKISLLKATFDAFQSFIKWIPLGYLFDSNITAIFITKFLDRIEFRNCVLQILSEIFLLTFPADYNKSVIEIFVKVFSTIQSTIPYYKDLDMAILFKKCNNQDAIFIKDVTIFLTTVISHHLNILESNIDNSLLLLSFFYLLKFTYIDDKEILKICLEFWQSFVESALKDKYNGVISSGLILSGDVRRHFNHSEIYSLLRIAIVHQMYKPEEVLVIEDENGEIVKQETVEVESITIYKYMKEILFNLTVIESEESERVLLDKLSKQIDGSEWNWNNLNKLCWAVGSISGSMNEIVEDRFIVTVIKNLLSLVEMKRGKDNKAIIATNIMYIVGQYPRFLKSHWKFLKTVANKLFEFMHETHEGVQDMACDTLIRITKQCGKQFIMLHAKEESIFFEEITERIPEIISDLNPQQVHSFYFSLGQILSFHHDASLCQKHIYFAMKIPNSSWSEIIKAVSSNVSLLEQPETLRSISNVLKTNISFFKSIQNDSILSQLDFMFLDMLALYRGISSFQQQILLSNNSHLNAMSFKLSRQIKRESLKLIDTFVCNLPNPDLFSAEYISTLFDTILNDYSSLTQELRDFEVLNLTASLIAKKNLALMIFIRPIFQSIFKSTLELISKDFTDYPEHRLAFFNLINICFKKCFGAISTLNQDEIGILIESMKWALKHGHREISSTGLDSFLTLFKCIDSLDKDNYIFIIKSFSMQIIQDVLFIIFDSDHMFEFDNTTELFSILINHILKPVHMFNFDSSIDNTSFLNSKIISLLTNAFPHIKTEKVQVFSTDLLLHYGDINSFRTQIKDFVIISREVSTL